MYASKNVLKYIWIQYLCIYYDDNMICSLKKDKTNGIQVCYVLNPGTKLRTQNHFKYINILIATLRVISMNMYYSSHKI